MQPISPFTRTVIRSVTYEEFNDMRTSGEYIIWPYNLNCRPVTPIPDSYLIKTPDGNVYEVHDWKPGAPLRLRFLRNIKIMILILMMFLNLHSVEKIMKLKDCEEIFNLLKMH